MNNLKIDCRRSTGRKIHLEYLDDRIVPSTVQPGLAAAAEVATAHATVNVAEQSQGTATAETKLEIRHENRIIKLEERREAAKEKRDARLEKLAARSAAAHQFSAATIVRAPASQSAASTATSANQSPTVTPQIPSGTFTPAFSTGSPPASTTPVTPVTTTPLPVSSGSSGSTTSTTSNPLPDNVSTILGTVYEEYQNGALPTSAQPGQVEIQGSSVGVQMRSSNSADFAAMVSAAQSLGLQVTTSSAAYDMVIGFLPISELPAAAQLTGAPAITPLLYPLTN
jgi:hypothetical protein